jgi:hypothetical protein
MVPVCESQAFFAGEHLGGGPAPGVAAVSVETSLFHSSCKRGCQEKTLPLSPLETCWWLTSSPVPLVEGFLVFAALDRRVLQRRCQPQLLVCREWFHLAVGA